MGASEFTARAKGKNAKEAFNAAIEDARYEDGNGGYTGTIAEKSSFKMVTQNPDESISEFIDRCIEDDDHWIQDKWGPAGCVLKGPAADGMNEYIFFGFASS